jgi:membrane protease YdiL (CAAX protease family)
MEENHERSPQEAARHFPFPYGLIGVVIGMLLGYLYVRATGYG